MNYRTRRTGLPPGDDLRPGVCHETRPPADAGYLHPPPWSVV